LELLDHDTVQSTDWGAGTSPGTFVATLIFPQLMDIDGTYINSNRTTHDSASLAYSADSTNGIDGTWTEQSAIQTTIFDTENEIPGHRDNVFSWTTSAIRALMVRFSEGGTTEANFIRAYEVFGEVGTAQSPDRLIFIDDATGLEYLIPQDYGDRPRGSAFDKDVSIKNNSGTLQASTIDVARGNNESTQDSSSWYTMDNGGGFSASFQVASLGAGLEDTFVLRQNIPGTAIPGVYEAWMEFDVNGSWS